MYKETKKIITLPGCEPIEISTGKLAKQSDGAVVVRQGDTMLLATVVAAKDAKEDVDFMPLSVEYKEKYAANGRFPGGFLKREARPNDSEILVSRLIDRALRPLFPADYHAEVFVTVNLISADADIQPDALAGLAASAALAVSDIPFQEPISECRVARVGGEYVVNPKFSQMEGADLDIIVAATVDNIMMVEGEMNEVSEAVMLEAIKIAHQAIKVQCTAQIELMEELGKSTKRSYCHECNDEAVRAAVVAATYDKAYAIATSKSAKHERSEKFDALEAEYIASLSEEVQNDGITVKLVKRYFHDNVLKTAMRDMILNEGVRLDGRRTDEIRPIWCEIGYLPAPHGSAVFTRGETQSLTTVTLGTKMDEKMIDEVLNQGTEKFVLHYNFPPFSTGEARPARGTSRREIGHGNLAFRALKPMMPSGADCPYAVRVVSDILESNGSSSMATVCAGTLALMDAGVKLRKPVSGIAMGLIAQGDRFAVLSDILGDEDHLGDMDFKVTGTADGITATQMDIKVDGLAYEVLEKALEQARVGRMHILGKITEVIAAPREDYKPHVPRMVQVEIAKDFIGAVIGPGGKVIQEMQKDTETTITITEVGDKGIIDIFGSNKEGVERAIARINGITAVPEVGTIYDGKVKSIVQFGAFVEILPGKDGLLHISEIANRRIEEMSETGLKEGDLIQVKLIGTDPKNGKLKLSRKVLLPKE